MSNKRLILLTAAVPLLFALTAAAKVHAVAAVKDGHDPNTCLSAVEVTYAPGEGSKPHHHDATIIAYVLNGKIDSKVGNEPVRAYGPGEHFVELPGVEHEVSRNASTTAPATFLAVTLAHRGSEDAQACGI